MKSPIAMMIPAFTLLALLLSGCIPGSTIGSEAQQEVVVQLTDTGCRTVENAQVTFTHDFRESFTMVGIPNDDTSYLDRNQEGSAITDATGHASLVLPTATVCDVAVPIIPVITFTSCPDPLSDQVTGELYLFRVNTEITSEFLPLRMRPGASVSGEFFTLTVVSIGEATPRVTQPAAGMAKRFRR
ncbi:MAG: hypothetical protein KAV82_09615 [Phycisphaerae bacterium]|nr:hypothetical protein [Phycisphaerae bacterium]